MATAVSATRIIRLNGGRMIGKTRLQKSAYFLESLGLGFGLQFDYHHYGPYSEDLAILADDAKALGMLAIEWHLSQEGAEYAVFIDKDTPLRGDDSEADKLRQAVLRTLNDYSAIELEIAATADFLAKRGYGDHAWEETRRRKASKISADRMARAKKLLGTLHNMTS